MLLYKFFESAIAARFAFTNDYPATAKLLRKISSILPKEDFFFWNAHWVKKSTIQLLYLLLTIKIVEPQKKNIKTIKIQRALFMRIFCVDPTETSKPEQFFNWALAAPDMCWLIAVLSMYTLN